MSADVYYAETTLTNDQLLLRPLNKHTFYSGSIEIALLLIYRFHEILNRIMQKKAPSLASILVPFSGQIKKPYDFKFKIMVGSLCCKNHTYYF